jgi:DNA-directed RNA polymerase subunit F
MRSVQKTPREHNAFYLARTAEQYVASFEALLLEEAREAVREEWGAKAALGKAYEADVLQ